MGAFLQDYNWFFWIPIGIATALIVLQFLGIGLSLFEAELDLDAGLDIDGGVDGGIDGGAEGLGGDASEIPDAAGLGPVLSFFHVGEVPFSILLALFCYSFGFGGLLTVALAIEFLEWSNTSELMWGGIAGAAVCATVVTRLGGGTVARLVPNVVTKSMSADQIVGRIAEVDSVEVTAESGRGHVIDESGDFYTLFLRLEKSVSEPIKKGSKVEIVRYQAKLKVYYCRPVKE